MLALAGALFLSIDSAAHAGKLISCWGNDGRGKGYSLHENSNAVAMDHDGETEMDLHSLVVQY